MRSGGVSMLEINGKPRKFVNSLLAEAIQSNYEACKNNNAYSPSLRAN